MNKVQEFFNSLKFKKTSQNLLVLLVIAIVIMSVYIFYKKGSEHYAPTPTCVSALQAYNAYQCRGDEITKLSGKTKVQLLKDVVDNCPEGSTLGSYSCDPLSADINIIGGTQLSNRTPYFFPGKEWADNVEGTNPTKWGIYNYK
jgi:hypothetical protein